MLLARIICSDPGCEAELEVAVTRLEELEGFACECGHGFVLSAVSELRQPGGDVVSITPPRRAAPAGRRAA